MATRNEHKTDKMKITPFGRKGNLQEDREVKQDGDAEAGVDAQVEQLNDMPNDPTEQPLEPTENKKSREA